MSADETGGVPPGPPGTSAADSAEQRAEEALTLELADQVPPPQAEPGAPDRTEQQPDPVPSAPGSPPNEDLPEGGTEQAPAVPGYRPVQKLGEGTYGQVWLYEDERTRVRVAIKFFARGRGLPWLLLQAEVKQLALLHADPGIVQLLDVEPDAQPPYYVMSYAPGGSLARRLEGGRRLAVGEALKVLREVAGALAYVHAKGIRHCDLKPGNVLLDARGRALLADFGQAHLSSDASPALGTYFYMAPEQADLAATIADTRWDVYGLGALAYAMLTGRPPREDPRIREELAALPDLGQRLRHYQEAVRAAPHPTAHRRVPGIDRALAAIIDRCLEVDPARRFRDAAAVLAALDQRERAQRRKPLLLFSLAAPLLLLVVLGLCAWVVGTTAVRESEAVLTRQVLESDRVSARLVAHVVQDELNDRITLLQRRAGEAGRAPTGGRGVGAEIKERDWKLLGRRLTEWDQQHVREQGNRLFTRWVLADSDGVIRASYPSRDWGDSRWAWRDWFNGQGDQPGRKEDRFAPLRQAHVSQPFVSEVERHLLSVCISVPVFDPEDKGKPAGTRQVVGLLMGVMRVDDLYKWVGHVDMDNGLVVLFNERGQYLLHGRQPLPSGGPPEPTPPFPSRRAGGKGGGWTDESPALRSALTPGDGTLEYADPLDGGRPYLAGYASFAVGDGRWAALVQHERGAALGPVRKLEQTMAAIGGVTLAVIALLAACLWGWLLWALRNVDWRMGEAG